MASCRTCQPWSGSPAPSVRNVLTFGTSVSRRHQSDARNAARDFSVDNGGMVPYSAPMTNATPDENGFVERPTRGDGQCGSARDESSNAGKLRATAGNGKSILLKLSQRSGLSGHLKKQGFRMFTTATGAPAGMIYAWCERIAPSERTP